MVEVVTVPEARANSSFWNWNYYVFGVRIKRKSVVPISLLSFFSKAEAIYRCLPLSNSCKNTWNILYPSLINIHIASIQKSPLTKLPIVQKLKETNSAVSTITSCHDLLINKTVTSPHIQCPVSPGNEEITNVTLLTLSSCRCPSAGLQYPDTVDSR